MVKLKSNLNRLFQGGVEIAFATKYFVKYILLLLAFSGSVYAQYNSVQSRFITSPGPFSQTCSIADSDAGCMPNTDGVVHMRFDLDNVRVDDNRTPDNSDDDRLVFKIQVRKISPQSGSALPYSVGGLGIDYNPALFGENLDGMSDVSEQCTYIRGDAFTGASYTLTVTDTSPGLLSLFEVADDFTDSNATANSFSEIDDWQDFIEMSCLIRFDADGNGSIDAGEGALDAEAGIALSRRLWAENQVWIASDGESDALNRTVFGFADNDLRGFRVDGKTWVQDYARYDDGKGVRVKFSKGITTKLEPQHFVLDADNAAVNIQTRHEAGSAYADIIFDTAINSGILRLVSTQNSIVMDESDEALADGSFVAALEYDADAPRAMNMVMTGDQYDGTVNRSTWAIPFNKPLNSNFTITADDLCITEMKGACVAVGEASMDMSSIDSVSLDEGATTLTVVINEGNGQMGGMRSLEFRRNAVLGADLRVVEDYQTELRDKIKLTDRIGPTITVTAAALARSSTLPFGYDISFTVSANEIVADLADTQSYLLAGRKEDNTIVAYSDISGTAETSADGTVTLSYQYEVNSSTIEALQDISGFTLLRATATALLDEADKEPIREDGTSVESYEESENDSNVMLTDARIDTRDEAIAMRDDTASPRLSLAKIGDAIPDMSNPRLYSGTFVVTADEAVADIASTSSYVILHKDLNDMLNEIDEAVITVSDVSDQTTEATVSFDVTFASLSDVRQTAGFTLARGSATSLLDMDFNVPVREGDGSDIASGDPIDSTVVVERGTSSLPISVEAVSLRRDIDPSANVRIYRYDAVPDSDDGNRYTVRFEVRSEISIPDIAEAASYSVIAKPIINQSTPTISEVTLVEALVNDTFDMATLTYSILMDSITATRKTAGFALVRANDSLQDMYSNEPTNSDGNIINNGDEIDARDAAFAERDTVVPQLAISVLQERLNSDGYQIEFDVDLGADHPADIRNVRSPGSYQLLRKLSDDSYVALETEPSDPTIRSGRNLYTQIRLSEAEARETVALGLGRRGEGDFLDLANNAPITVGLDNVPVASGAPLDVSVGAEAKPNEPHPSVTVEAQGMARVNESNPLVYEGSFVLTANAPIENRLLRAANYPNDIPSLADTGSYWLQRIPVGGGEATTRTAQFTITNVEVTNNTSRATSATLSFMTTFDSLDEVMQTQGFTLARRDNLLDYASNYPVDPVDADREVARGDRLDARDAAVALRDMTAPSITVTTSGDLSIEASGYTMAFEVSVPDDVPSGSGSDARTITSYRLLRKLNDGNYAVVSGVLPRSVAQSSAITVGYVNVPLLSPADALLTEGFTLGRTVGSLRDTSGNDPVVEINVEGTPQTVVVTVTPPLPLDAKAAALFAIERINPKLTVVAGTANKVADDRYIGSFNVWSGADATLDGATDEEAIEGIESAASYVLLRVPSGTNNPVALSDAVITVVADLDSYRSATVSFEVEDAQAAVGDKFTLGRAARLTDLSGNALIAYDATDASDPIGDDEPIDSRPEAEADVPPDVVTSPQINVTALPAGNGVATADPNNPLRYTGSFSVTADRAVTGIGNADSYKLLRIARDGTHEETKASSTTIIVTVGETTADAVGEETTMTFAVTLGAAMVAQTRGFTLGRKANLQDGETLPLFDAARADRLDASARAVAEIEITAQITVLATTDAAGIGAQPDEADGDRYSMTFVVRSSIAITDIGSMGSYILLHLPTEGDDAIADLSPYIETSSVDANPSGREATLRYTVRFTDTATQTQKTAGFTLGRADGALLGGESVIDASEAAKARRDTTPPVISVQIDSNRVSAAGYDIGFTLSSDNNERVRGLASAGNYVLLRQLTNNTSQYTTVTAVIAFTETLPQSPIASVSLASRARLTVADARETAAFTIGYGGATPLRDLANNDVVSATVNQPYDSNVLAARDMDAPFLSVPRYEASLVESALDEVPAGNYYDIVFDIKAQQEVGGSRVDADDVRGLASVSSYRLIRSPSNSDVAAAADTAEITSSSPSQVTLSYRRVFLTLEQTRETESFTLGRALADVNDPYDCKLCDFASNPPNVESGEVIDSNAIAALDKEGESMRVIALGDAEPSEFNPNIYLGSFRVETDNPVADIADVASYSLLRVPLNEDGSAGDAVAVATMPTLTLIGDGQAPTNATIAFEIDLVDLGITQGTYGFTLGLAPNDDADDCNLCDAAGNSPIDEDGMPIAVGAPLDSTSVAIARRDIEAPVIQVVASGDLTISPSGYSMAFKVAPPADVHQTTNSVPRLTSSYSLLRKDMSGNYAVVPTSPPQPIAQSGDIVVTYDNVPPLPIAVMQNTEAFALGLATDGIFRDASGNDAVVELEGMTEVVTVNPRRPLDARDDALFTIERDAPTITVTANADSITKVGDVYTGSFDVSGSEAIDGITSTASYVLLRVRSGIEPVSLTNAQITLSATVNFRVTDTAAQDGDKYTLGRAANLTDLAGNAPVDPEDDTNVITIGERIDSRTTAELAVPTADTTNPIITVTAVGTEGMEAVADAGDPLAYSGRFDVEASKSVAGISFSESYKLLRITAGGEHKQITANLEVSKSGKTASDRGTTETITFTTKLGSAEVLQQTVGFTLGRLANLADTEGQPPISYTADRLDARDEAVAAVDAPPRITVTAERSFIDADGTEVLDASSATFPSGIEAVPYAGDGDKYNLSFRVRSSEAIADIMSASSYILKHLPTADGGDPIDLSPYILASAVQTSTSQIVNNTEVLVKYTVRFADIAETQRTAGFVLHRAGGKLQDSGGNTPLDRDYNPILAEGIIDPGEAAISRRDTTSPELRIRMRGRLDRHRLTGEWTYDISATVSSYPAESMSRSFFDAWYNLLRVIDTQPVSYARARPGDGEGSSIADISFLNTRVPIAFDNYNLTELRARKTIGFSVGHTVSRGKIYDLSNNEAFRGGTTQTLVLDQDQPVDARPSTWGRRERIPPVIEVRATTATAVGNDAYDVSFNVRSKIADDLRTFAMVVGLDSPASYQLLLEYEADMYEKVQSPMPRVTRINNFSATVHYEGVSLASQSQTGRLSFALGRVPPVDEDDTDCHLCDLEKNAPVAAPPAGESIDNSNPLSYDYVDDEPLDANSYAKAAIIQPRIKVAAVGIAEPSLDDGDEYTMQFKVETNDAIQIASADSYRLIHIPTTGTAAISLSTSNYIDSVNVDGSADSRMSTVSYVVKFDNTEAQTQRTKGFTLGRGGDLEVFNEMNMLIGAGGRLDASPEAVAFRDTISPQIAIAADGKAVRDLYDTTLYSMHFDVTVANDDEVRGLTDPDSYQLLQFIKDVAEPMILGDDDIESTTTVTVIDGGVKLSYENVRIDMNSVEMIDAFTLGRAGTSLRDLANNDPVDAKPENMAEKIDEDGEPLDSRDGALAELIRGILLRVKVFLEGPYR